MSSLTIVAKTREEAEEQALEKTGLPREALEFQDVGGLGELISDRMAPVREDSVTLKVSLKPEYTAEMARKHLQKMLQIMRIQAELLSSVDANAVKLRINAPDGAILIGRQGQTLDALQHLINRMAIPPGIDAPFVSIDVEDYRERRIARLERLARSGAREALETKEEIELDSMSRADRKIVHMTLRANPAVHTFSKGDEGDRYVVISPKPARQDD
jgi:spoIIIJ-associated protein